MEFDAVDPTIFSKTRTPLRVSNSAPDPYISTFLKRADCPESSRRFQILQFMNIDYQLPSNHFISSALRSEQRTLLPHKHTAKSFSPKSYLFFNLLPLSMSLEPGCLVSSQDHLRYRGFSLCMLTICSRRRPKFSRPRIDVSRTKTLEVADNFSSHPPFQISRLADFATSASSHESSIDLRASSRSGSQSASSGVQSASPNPSSHHSCPVIWT